MALASPLLLVWCSWVTVSSVQCGLHPLVDETLLLTMLLYTLVSLFHMVSHSIAPHIETALARNCGWFTHTCDVYSTMAGVDDGLRDGFGMRLQLACISKCWDKPLLIDNSNNLVLYWQAITYMYGCICPVWKACGNISCIILFVLNQWIKRCSPKKYFQACWTCTYVHVVHTSSCGWYVYILQYHIYSPTSCCIYESSVTLLECVMIIIKKQTSNIDTQTSIIDTRRQDNINHWDLKYNFNLCLQLSIRSNEQITKIGRKFLSIIDWNKSDSGLWSKSDLTTGRDNRRGQVSVSTTSLVRQKFG
jgi:hypothetical protein